MEMDDKWLYDINGVDVYEEVAKELEEALIDLQVNMAMYAYEEHPDSDWEPPSGGYGCMACEECYARETLALIVPIITRAVLAGTIRSTRIKEIAPGVDTSGVTPLIAGTRPDHQASETDVRSSDRPVPVPPAPRSICRSCGEPDGVHRLDCKRPR